MLKTLLASASLSLALLFLPLGSFGPITTLGGAGLAPAHAIDIGVEIGGGDDDEDGGGVSIELGGDDEDGADDDDDDGDRRGISCQRAAGASVTMIRWPPPPPTSCWTRPGSRPRISSR